MKETVRLFTRKIFDELTEIRFAASSLAFSTLFALIPFLIVILAFFQMIGGLEQLYPQVEALLLGYLKEATGVTVTNYLKNTLSQVQAKTLGVTGLLALALTTMGLLRNVDQAFHRIWKVKPQRPFYKRMFLYSVILVCTPAILAMFIGLRSVNFVQSISQGVEHQFLISVWLSLALWVLFTIIPSIKVHRISAFISAALTSLALAMVQESFLWFSLKIFKKNKIYGSIASFPIFLLWLLVVWYIILAGVSLCAFLQQKIFKRS